MFTLLYSEVYRGPGRKLVIDRSLLVLQVSMSQSIPLSKNPGGLEMHAQMYCIVYMVPSSAIQLILVSPLAFDSLQSKPKRLLTDLQR